MSQPFRYRIEVAWSDEDGAYLARVPTLGSRYIAHGDTPAAAAQAARVAAELWLEDLAAHGEEIPPADVGAASA